MLVPTEEFEKYNDGNHWHFTGTDAEAVKTLHSNAGVGSVVLEGNERCYSRSARQIFNRYHIVCEE